MEAIRQIEQVQDDKPRFSISLKSRCVNRRKFSGQIEGF